MEASLNRKVLFEKTQGIAGGNSHVQIDDELFALQICHHICAQGSVVSFPVHVGGHFLGDVGVLFAKIVLLLIVNATAIPMSVVIEDLFSTARENTSSLLGDEQR